MNRLFLFTGFTAIILTLLAPQVSYGQVKIGDLHEGGIVFYVDESGEQGLVCQPKDLGNMKWHEAVDACKELGDGWRLPRKNELNLMYTNLHKRGFGDFYNLYYWCSAPPGSFGGWMQYFGNGRQQDANDFIDLQVRAVRAFGGCKVGDHIHGGIVFYVDDTGKHGVVCQTEDLKGTYNMSEAIAACKELGDSWRLPTKDELNKMYINLQKNGLGGFVNNFYWSSTEADSGGAWKQYFGNGALFAGKSSSSRVRAVRGF